MSHQYIHLKLHICAQYFCKQLVKIEKTHLGKCLVLSTGTYYDGYFLVNMKVNIHFLRCPWRVVNIVEEDGNFEPCRLQLAPVARNLTDFHPFKLLNSL